MPGWKADIIDLVDFAFGRLRARLEGLSDEEYLWEPAPGCWSIRADEHGRMRGDWVQSVWPAPLTTLAWRLGHIINNLCDPRYATWLGLTPAGPPPESLPASASAALAELERAFSVTRGYLESMSDASLGEIMGTVAGPWADNDKGAYVLHMVDELIHHGAEVALLRDLYRASQEPNPVIAALLAGDRTGVDAAMEARPDA